MMTKNLEKSFLLLCTLFIGNQEKRNREKKRYRERKTTYWQWPTCHKFDCKPNWLSLAVLLQCKWTHKCRGSCWNCSCVPGQSGARWVLVALWAINGKARKKFMSRFYENLVSGESASESLHQVMKWMRANGFSYVGQWAPFMLIRDNVPICGKKIDSTLQCLFTPYFIFNA